MRILRPIVQALMLAMLNVKLHFPARRGVGLEFVGDHDAWRLNGAFQEFRQEALRRSAVSPFLDQNVENKAVLIDRAPEPVSFAGDGNDESSSPGELHPQDRVTGGGRPPPVPTERGVRISRTTLFGRCFTAFAAICSSFVSMVG